MAVRTTRQTTLQRRILVIFLLCMVSAVGCMALVLGVSYNRLVVQRVNASYESNVQQFTHSLENLISTLNHTSQQLAFSEDVAQHFERYLTSGSSYERIQMHDTLKNAANFVVLSNPSIGLYAYVSPQNGHTYISNMHMGDDWHQQLAPNELFRYSGAAYYGPFPSVSCYTNNQVLAITRDIEVAGHPVQLYVETGFRVMEDLMSSYAMEGCQLLILDNQQRVAYSQLEEVFPRGSEIPESPPASHRLFSAQANQGWRAAIAVENAVYMREMRSLIKGMSVVALVLLAVFMLSAVMLWRHIYRPLDRFDKLIDSLLTEDGEAAAVLPVETGILEYDRLLSKFQFTRQQLQEMIVEIRRQEQTSARMMLRRLRSQINPHFLMNTLNTVHWMAVMKNETEIDDIVLALNRLLAYNLKQGEDLTTLGSEIYAVEQYIQLQRRRYDIQYQMILEPEGASTDIPFPKFILQPLVENSLYHAYRQNMSITLRVNLSDRIVISVEDTGIGMDESTKQVLAEHLSGSGEDAPDQSSGMGIGLRYVVKTLHMFYDGDVQFRLESQPDQFTIIEMSIPLEVKAHD